MNALRSALAAAGVLLVVEAVASLFIDSHLGYHALNLPQQVALAVAAFLAARACDRPGRIAFRVAAALAALAGLAGAAALVAEGLVGRASPDVVEGIGHTAVLAVFLAWAVAAAVAWKAAPWPRAVLGAIAATAGGAVALVLVGFDDPRVFVLPQAGLGAALLWAAFRG